MLIEGIVKLTAVIETSEANYVEEKENIFVQQKKKNISLYLFAYTCFKSKGKTFNDIRSNELLLILISIAYQSA